MINKKLFRNISRIILIIFVITSSVCFSKGGRSLGHIIRHISRRSISTRSRSLIRNRNSKIIKSKRSNLSIRTSNISRTNQVSNILSLMFFLLFIVHGKFIQYKRNKISINRKKYINRFLKKFSNINNIPKWNDIRFFYNNLKEKVVIDEVLIPLIINKINSINKMSLSEQYNFYYNQNIKQIDIFQLEENTISSNEIKYTMQESNEINNLLRNNQYIKLNMMILVNEINKNNEYVNVKHAAVIYFNQKLIFKEILLKAFLYNAEENKLVRSDIINQLKDYYSNRNKIIYLNKYKVQLLIDAIKENISENIQFRDKFLEVFKKV